MFYLSETKKRYCRYFSLLAVVILGVVSILGTGGGGDSTPPPPAAPSVDTVFPKSTDAALVTSLVTVQFNTAMDESTLNDPATNFFVVDDSTQIPVPGSVEYYPTYEVNHNYVAVFTPTTDLNINNPYTATVTTDVKDSSGIPLVRDYVWSFTIAPNLTLVSADANGVAGNNYDGADNSDISATGDYIVFVSKEDLAPGYSTGGVAQIYRKNTVTGKVEVVSLNSNNALANGNCSSPRINDTGRYVAFASTATNLAPPGSNPGGINHIYRKDMRDGTLSLLDVTHNNASLAGDEPSTRPDISALGNFIVFESNATNLVDNDTNGLTDIFIRNYSSGTIERISIATNGDESKNGSSYNPRISSDGSRIVFESEASDLVSVDVGGHRDILYRDRTGSTTTLVSVDSSVVPVQADADSFNAVISDDGNYVVFQSDATNLVTGDTNSMTDIFLRDLVSTTTTRISLKSDGSQTTSGQSASPAINADGSYVAFTSNANDLVSTDPNGTVADVFVLNTSNANSIKLLSLPSPPNNQAIGYGAAISANSRYVSFVSTYSFDVLDTNGLNDIYRAYNSALP
jgi:hypothetical protein